MNQNNKLNFKLCILGDGGVGKTTLIRRFLSGRYLGNTKMTIGVDFHIYRRTHGNRSLSFQIWDLSGQERFQRMHVFDKYVQGSHVVMLAVDLSRIDTFENLPTWLEVAQNADNQPLLILVGTKKDLEREIDKEFLAKWACEQGFSHIIETSSLTGENVNELFELISSELITRWENSSVREMVTLT
ncbi:MAG: Rab family GTPase [Candidatus Heimdallarchaeota archaeon]